MRTTSDDHTADRTRQGVVSLVLSKAKDGWGTRPVHRTNRAANGPSPATPVRATSSTRRPLIGDRPVVAKAQLVYRFPWGIMAAGNLQHQTGRFYTRAVRVAGLGFPAAPQINMEANTGDRRVANINLFDVRVQKEFTLARSTRFDVFLDALNLTNSDQFESVGSALGTSSAFGVATRYIPPRRLQVGAKFRW